MITNLDFTFIGKNSLLKGDFTFSSDTKISGRIEGNVTVLNNAKLTLEIGSYFIGNLSADQIEIYGNFYGEISSTGNLVIFPTGNVEGKVMAKSIEVLPGANLNISGHTHS